MWYILAIPVVVFVLTAHRNRSRRPKIVAAQPEPARTLVTIQRNWTRAVELFEEHCSNVADIPNSSELQYISGFFEGQRDTCEVRFFPPRVITRRQGENDGADFIPRLQLRNGSGQACCELAQIFEAAGLEIIAVASDRSKMGERFAIHDIQKKG